MGPYYWARMTKSAAANPVDNFIEQMGLITQEEGGPRIAGRIFGLLIVEGRPLTLNDMAERLDISKASASTNARLLADRGLLRRADLPGDRQDYYDLEPSPYPNIIRTMTAKIGQAATRVEEAERLIPGEYTGAKERVRELAEFYRQSADFMAEWSARLKVSS